MLLFHFPGERLSDKGRSPVCPTVTCLNNYIFSLISVSPGAPVNLSPTRHSNLFMLFCLMPLMEAGPVGDLQKSLPSLVRPVRLLASWPQLIPPNICSPFMSRHSSRVWAHWSIRLEWLFNSSPPSEGLFQVAAQIPTSSFLLQTELGCSPWAPTTRL